MFSQAKLILAAVVVAIIGGLLWRDKIVTKQRNEARAEARQIKADYAAYKAAAEHERKIGKDATDDYERRLNDLQMARTDTPVRSVRLCRSPSGWVPAPSPTASGTDAGSESGHQSEARQDPGVSRDLGPELYALADEKDEQLARCAALQGWVRSR